MKLVSAYLDSSPFVDLAGSSSSSSLSTFQFTALQELSSSPPVLSSLTYIEIELFTIIIINSFQSLVNSDSSSHLLRILNPFLFQISFSNSPRRTPHLATPITPRAPAMDLFQNAKAVRLKSSHGKYLTADDDEESVTQDRNGSSKSAKWFVEFLPDTDHIIRLRSCYGKYLTASNHPFLLGMTGRKVTQTKPSRLDSSVEWEPIKENGAVKLKTRYGQYLRANGGLPPWRNSVTHDIPHRTATQEWIQWEVHVVEILEAPTPRPAAVYSVGSDSGSPTTSHSSKSGSFSRQESNDSMVNSPPKGTDGRTIYYHIANEYGEIDEGFEELCITFKGNGVQELTKMLEAELGLDGVTVCSRSPLNGKLYPLRLQLPPNNATMHIVVVPPSSQGNDPTKEEVLA